MSKTPILFYSHPKGEYAGKNTTLIDTPGHPLKEKNTSVERTVILKE